MKSLSSQNHATQLVIDYFSDPVERAIIAELPNRSSSTLQEHVEGVLMLDLRDPAWLTKRFIEDALEEVDWDAVAKAFEEEHVLA